MGPTLDYKAVPVGGVEDTDAKTGVVEAIVSVTGLKDNVNDIIQPGAFQKSLAKRTPKGVWHHNIQESVAKTTEIKELAPGDPKLPETLPNGEPWPDNAGALMVKMVFNLSTQRGKDAYEDVKFFGTDQEWSIGYNVPTGGATLDRKTGTRMINTLDLYEYSPVLFGAMPNARTVSVKSAQEAHKVLLGLNTDEGRELKALWDELVADEVKAAKKKRTAGNDEDETEESEQDSEKTPATEGPDKEDETTDSEEDDSEDAWEDDDEEVTTSKKKRGTTKGVVLDATGVDLLDQATKSLTALRDFVIEGVKADAESNDSSSEDSGDSESLASLVDAAGLDCADAASDFDSAVSDGDADKMESSGNTVLDAVEAAKESGDADTASLKRVTSYIASAFQSVDAEEPTEEKETEEKSEIDGETIDYIMGWGTKREFSGKERDKASDKGHAMPDGSFPIENESDLKNAIKAYGRAKDKDAAKKHIIKRARALGLTDLLPEDWGLSKAEDEIMTLDRKELFAEFGMEVN